MFNTKYDNKKNLLKAKANIRKLGLMVQSDGKKSQGVGGTWEFASDKAVETILQQPLVNNGLEFVALFGTDAEGKDWVGLDLVHVESGEFERVTICIGSPATGMINVEFQRQAKASYWQRSQKLKMLNIPTLNTGDSWNTVNMMAIIEEKASKDKPQQPEPQPQQPEPQPQQPEPQPQQPEPQQPTQQSSKEILFQFIDEVSEHPIEKKISFLKGHFPLCEFSISGITIHKDEESRVNKFVNGLRGKTGKNPNHSVDYLVSAINASGKLKEWESLQVDSKDIQAHLSFINKIRGV